MQRLYHPGQQLQQASLPPAPVTPAQVAHALPSQPALVQQQQQPAALQSTGQIPNVVATQGSALQQQVTVVPGQPATVMGVQPIPLQQHTLMGGQLPVPVHGGQATPLQQPVQMGMQVPTAIHGSVSQATGSAVPPVNLQASTPSNPVLQSALYQVMMHQGNPGTVTMDDVGNLLLTSGRASVHYCHNKASEQNQRQFQRH